MAVDRTRFPPEVLAHYQREAARPGAIEGMLAYYRAGVRFPSSARGKGTVDAPTLIIWGEKDTALGAGLASESVGYLSQGTLRWIPDCSHWVQQEQPDQVNAILEPWLRGQEPPVLG
jgi:pimeloyl-ACP methyl ester carboxylesterase